MLLHQRTVSILELLGNLLLTTTMTRLITLLSIFIFSFQLHPSVGSSISISNNGYCDIVVAISPNVEQDQAGDLLKNIQVSFQIISINSNNIYALNVFQLMITDASSALYTATRKRSFIQSVSIVIPQSWQSIEANSSLGEFWCKFPLV